jgi:hypothetical protein
MAFCSYLDKQEHSTELHLNEVYWLFGASISLQSWGCHDVSGSCFFNGFLLVAKIMLGSGASFTKPTGVFHLSFEKFLSCKTHTFEL